ncbi:MAG: carboxylate--amine ligase [Blastochloris sp.]|nr:carboxylate--amine ligase [Blastochloris sp.]
MNVLGLSDQPYDTMRPELRAALTEYYRVSDLHNYDDLVRALGYFTHRYGKIDRIDSLNEYWLETEARLRTDFNVEGFKLGDLPGIKRKSEMKRMFTKAHVDVARGQLVRTAGQARTFVETVGYPIVAKPDIGVGANKTYKITNAQELEEFLARPLVDYFLEEYIHGVIQTFDGLADRSGNLVYYTSMEYSHGVMEIVNNDGDIFYFTHREIPPDLEHAGRNIIKTFNVRERFFHFEFFRTPEGRLVALEVNMRPPGGLSLDMFNYAGDINLYYEWANVVVNNRFTTRYSWPYYACYVGRKTWKSYAHPHDAVLAHCGDHLILHQPMASMFHQSMGDYGYIVRTPEFDEMLACAHYIHER